MARESFGQRFSDKKSKASEILWFAFGLVLVIGFMAVARVIEAYKEAVGEWA